MLLQQHPTCETRIVDNSQNKKQEFASGSDANCQAGITKICTALSEKHPTKRRTSLPYNLFIRVYLGPGPVWIQYRL